MKFFQFLVATEAFMPKPGNKQFTMDNIDYNPQRDGKWRAEFIGQLIHNMDGLSGNGALEKLY